METLFLKEGDNNFPLLKSGLCTDFLPKSTIGKGKAKRITNFTVGKPDKYHLKPGD